MRYPAISNQGKVAAIGEEGSNNSLPNSSGVYALFDVYSLRDGLISFEQFRCRDVLTVEYESFMSCLGSTAIPQWAFAAGAMEKTEGECNVKYNR